MARHFWGIAVPAAVGRLLEDWIRRYGPSIPAKRWYGSSQFHITLLFFGDRIDGCLEEVRFAAGETVRSIPAFRVHLDRIGVFPRAGVIWQGLHHSPPLFDLRNRLWKAAEALGATGNDRPAYRPHITLGRLSRPWRPENLQSGAGAALAGTPFEVSRVHLYRSETTPGGPVYRVVQTYPLAPPEEASPLPPGPQPVE
ncbi:MAG: RNA 2',3'-cyclic phosphodiesterase [Alicyclobacillaceae bacterium]|nr:RNA 2',3'-cyclic phosphodiesterase [Alicyclobacillaceae bacterium]